MVGFLADVIICVFGRVLALWNAAGHDRFPIEVQTELVMENQNSWFYVRIRDWVFDRFDCSRHDACPTHVEHSTINVGCNARAAALSPVVYGLLQPI